MLKDFSANDLVGVAVVIFEDDWHNNSCVYPTIMTKVQNNNIRLFFSLIYNNIIFLLND
jgi:hypothetical protein